MKRGGCYANDQLSISGGNSVSLAPYSQTLTFTGTTLGISGGNNVDLAGLKGGDAQTLTLANNQLGISGGNSVDLNSLLSNSSGSLGTTGNVSFTLKVSGTVAMRFVPRRRRQCAERSWR